MTISPAIWLCLGVCDFISRAIHTVSRFESIVVQIQKNEQDIESKLQSLVTANLLKFPVPDKSTDLPGETLSMILSELRLKQLDKKRETAQILQMFIVLYIVTIIIE